MFKSLIAILSGQVSITLLQAFSRALIGIYHRSEISITGISHLPSYSLMYFLTGLNLLFGLFAGLITSSIAQKKGLLEVLVLSLLIFTGGLFSFEMTAGTEPVWYRILAPLLTVAGILAGYFLKINMDTNPQYNDH